LQKKHIKKISEMNDGVEISVIIPVYNESDNINNLFVELQPVLKGISSDYEIIFVDDGSKDDSFQKICQLHEVDNKVRGISLSRNFGHQAAIWAGIENAKGNVVITMDADLQHPPKIINTLYSKYLEGHDIVNTIRKETQDADFFKKMTSAIFYRLINSLSETKIEPAAADFRLMNRKTVDAFLQLKEKSRFTRGLISWMGFDQVFVEYEAPARFSGKSKFTIRKMFHFAADGITSFSSKPLLLAFYIGIFVSFFSLLYGFYIIYAHFNGEDVPGWASMLLSILFLGGIQLITLGVIGIYLSRIFNEGKNRPPYFIKNKI